MNCITSSIPQSGTGSLNKLPFGDSEIFDGSAGVVEVAASCSGTLRLGGGATLTSQLEQSLTTCSNAEKNIIF